MLFLNPILLAAGLGCIALPIIIHILMRRRRRRPIAWGAMKFLLEAYRQQRRRLRFEQFLLLATRCLLIALLALAVGKPILGAAGLLSTRGPRTLYIIIDNSLTATAITSGGTELDLHKAAAAQLLTGLDAAKGDRIAVVALGAPADGMILPPTSDIAAAGSLIKDLKPTDARADMDGALAMIRDTRRSDTAARGSDELVVVLSGFRVGSADTEATLPALGDGTTPLHIYASPPSEEPLNNVAIISAEPLQSVVVVPSGGVAGSEGGTDAPVRVELKRSGPGIAQSADTKLRIEVAAADQRIKGTTAEKVVRWAPGEESTSVTLSVDFPPGVSARSGLILRATIDRDAVEGDNVFERPIETRERLNVAIITQAALSGRTSIDKYTPADWLALALEPTDDGSLRTRRAGEIAVSLIDPTRDLADPRGQGPLIGVDAILIPSPDQIDAAGWRRVRAAADNGALIFVMPPAHSTVQTWTDGFLEAMNLDWTIGRETKSFSAATIATERNLAPGADLLTLIAAELTELVKPVTVSRALDIKAKPGGGESLLTLADGTPLLMIASPGAAKSDKPRSSSRGLIALLAVAPDLAWTDLPAKPLMVPLVQEVVRQGMGRAQGPRIGLAGATPLLPASASELARVSSRTTTRPGETEFNEVIPVDQAGKPATPLRHAGVWRARSASGLTLATIAINADPAASRTDLRAKEDITRWLSTVSPAPEFLSPTTLGAPSGTTSVLDQRHDAPPVSLPLLIAAAAIGLIEVVLARLFSHAKMDAAPALAPEAKAAA